MAKLFLAGDVEFTTPKTRLDGNITIIPAPSAIQLKFIIHIIAAVP